MKEFENALDVLIQNDSQILKTGIDQIDDLVQIKPSTITEFAGTSASFKTRSAVRTCLTTLESNPQSTVLYVTTKSFTKTTFTNILTSHSSSSTLQHDSICNRFKIIKCFDIFTFTKTLQDLSTETHPDYTKNLRLLVVDGINCLFFDSVKFVISSIVIMMKKLAFERQFAILTINGCVSDWTSRDGELKPSLGVNWSSFPKQVVFFKRLDDPFLIEQPPKVEISLYKSAASNNSNNNTTKKKKYNTLDESSFLIQLPITSP